MNELEKLNKQIGDKQVEQANAGKAIDELTAKRDEVRRANYGEKTLKAAADRGLNPDNYRNEKHLKEAIARFDDEIPGVAQPPVENPGTTQGKDA